MTAAVFVAFVISAVFALLAVVERVVVRFRPEWTEDR